MENSLKEIWVTQSSSQRDKQGSAPEPQPLAPNPVPATEDHTPYLQERDDLLSSDGESVSDNNCEEKKNKIPRVSDDLSSGSEQDFPSPSAEKDWPPLTATKAGILPRPMEPPASGKMHGQWEIPLSFHPHDIPTATLASNVTAHAQAPVRGKAKAPRANSKTNAPPAAPTQREAYDLLADFPALQPPKKALALGAVRDGNPKALDAEGKRGLARSSNHRQESGAPRQRRMENVPHGVFSICAGAQKSVLALQTFGSTSRCNSPPISCEEGKANNQPPPRGNKSAVCLCLAQASPYISWYK